MGSTVNSQTPKNLTFNRQKRVIFTVNRQKYRLKLPPSKKTTNKEKKNTDLAKGVIVIRRWVLSVRKIN